SKRVIGCDFPSSRTSKASRVRFVASRPSRSNTVTKTRTASPVPRKTGCCQAAAPIAPRRHAESVPNVRNRTMPTTPSCRPGTELQSYHKMSEARGSNRRDLGQRTACRRILTARVGASALVLVVVVGHEPHAAVDAAVKDVEAWLPFSQPFL